MPVNRKISLWATFLLSVSTAIAITGTAPNTSGDTSASTSGTQPGASKISGSDELKRLLLHSHNDYERAQPLIGAIEHGFDSVEVDIWFNASAKEGQRLMVSHTNFLPFIPANKSLEDLYLRPLAERVLRLGSVHGDDRDFLVWIDLKEHRREFIEEVKKTLVKYRIPKVQIILTGDPVAKSALSEFNSDLLRINEFDPSAITPNEWYSLKWSSYFKWTGLGDMPQAEKSKLRELVMLARQKKRHVRFYGTPESEKLWQECQDSGITMISTDDLSRLQRFRVVRHIPAR